MANTFLISWLAIDSLVANPNNARTHNKRQVRQIADSIRCFGFNNPILIDQNNMILAGHGRWEAAKLLKLSQVPSICLNHLTAPQVRAYVIADNQLALKAGWDEEILGIELQGLLDAEMDFDITMTGFDIPDIDRIIEGTNKSGKSEAPEILESGPVVTSIGDIWQLGRHKILCGNALDEASYDVLMQGKTADLVFFDAPYNVNIKGHVSGKGRAQHREFAMACGEMSSLEFTDFLTVVSQHLAIHSKDGSIHYACMDWKHTGEMLDAGRAVYSELKNICVWTKNNGGMGSLYRSQHELVFVFKNGTAAHTNNVQLGKFARNRTNVWAYPNANTFSRNGEEGNLAALHPTVKPVNLVADAILDCSNRRELVLDSFLGSGTTLIAAERVGRICYGMELDPLYVDVIIRRWQNLTGDQAVQIHSGKCFDQLAAASEVGNV